MYFINSFVTCYVKAYNLQLNSNNNNHNAWLNSFLRQSHFTRFKKVVLVIQKRNIAIEAPIVATKTNLN